MRLEEALLETKKRYEEKLNSQLQDVHYKYHMKKQKYLDIIANL